MLEKRIKPHFQQVVCVFLHLRGALCTECRQGQQHPAGSYIDSRRGRQWVL